MPKTPTELEAIMDRLAQDRMYLAVVDSGSFAAAARRMGVSSGQASKLVAALEADLGVQLLNRTTRSLAVTEVGRAYHLRLKDLLAEYDALEASVRDTSEAPAGLLRLSAPETFGMSQLLPVLLTFGQKHPKVQLDVSFSDRAVNLIEEGFDMALRIGEPPDSGLIARKLCMARVVTIAAPDYLALRGQPQRPLDLLDHDCIIDTNFRDAAHWRFPGEAPIAVNGRLRFSNAGASLAAAEAGLGIARVPSFIAGPKIRDGKVTRLLAAFDSPSRPVHALYPPSRHLAPKIRLLVDHLAEAFRGEPEWDRGWQ